MAGIDALKPGKALGLGVLLAGVNPKNLMLAAAAGAALAQIGLSTGDVVGSLIVFVIVGSVTIAAPVVYYCSAAPPRPVWRKEELARAAQRRVMAVLLLVFGVNLVAMGLPLRT